MMLALVFWFGQALIWIGIGCTVLGTKITVWSKVHAGDER